MLVVVFGLCCGFHTVLELLDTVIQYGDSTKTGGGGEREGSVAGGGVSRVDRQSGLFPQYSAHMSQGSAQTWNTSDSGGGGSGGGGGGGSDGSGDGNKLHETLLTFALWLLVINSVLNPFLYAITSQRFRFFAARLLSRHEPGAARAGGHATTGPYGGHLFDVSIYSAFLRNLQTPVSRHSSGDSCDLAQTFPLTQLPPEHCQAQHGSALNRRDSSSSAHTASTVVDNSSRGSASPLEWRSLSEGGFRGGSSTGHAGGRMPKNYSAPKFLSVPTDEASSRKKSQTSDTAAAAAASSQASAASQDSDDGDGFPRNNSSDLLLQRQTSNTSAASVWSNVSGGTVRSGTLSLGGEDFYFSSNNAARIRIVLDLV
jgi:hypothetical protein